MSDGWNMPLAASTADLPEPRPMAWDARAQRCNRRSKVTEAQLKVLLAVADLGGFSLASERLAMSQPGVSRAVASLEEELGVRLLTRRRGAVSLTNVGVHVAMHARGVLAHSEAIRQEAGQVAGNYAGHLRIGSLPSLSAELMSPILARFHERHPGAEVELFEAPDEHVVYWIRSRSVDVGLVARDPPDLDVTHLRDTELLGVLPATHPAAGGEAVPLAALEHDPFVVPGNGFERIVAELFAAEGRAPRVEFEVSETMSAVAIVAAGLGVAVVPDLLLDEFPPTAVALPLDPPVVLPLGLAVRSENEAPPAVTAFVDAAG
jgi:DNA-binding transcriptional LysR family regulator